MKNLSLKSSLKFLAAIFIVTIVSFAFVCKNGLASYNTAKENSKNEKPKIINIQTEGNLQKTHDLACIGIDDAINIYTPADLYASATKCIMQDNNKNAIEIHALANIYARYDVMRISDQTVRGGISVMMMNTYGTIDKNRIQKFSKEAKEFYGSPNLNILCQKITKIGKPNYYPKYLIQHGLNSMRNDLENKERKDDGLIKNYDAEKNWSELMENYLKCKK